MSCSTQAVQIARSIATEWRRLIDNLQASTSHRTIQHQLDTACNMLFIPNEVVQAAKSQQAGSVELVHASIADTTDICRIIISPHTVSAHAVLFVACVSDQIACKIENKETGVYITTIMSIAY